MFDVCPRCGMYHPEKTIDPAGPFAICPACGHAHHFVHLPLFVITGASGAGKSTVAVPLSTQLSGAVVLESDILWGPHYNTPEDDFQSFSNIKLRVAKNISQAGRPVVLCGSGIPAQYELSPQRRYFTQTHYLALVCSDEAITTRLQTRPAWRNTHQQDVIERMTGFNRWLIDHADSTDPPMTLLNNTEMTVDDCVKAVQAWIETRL